MDYRPLGRTGLTVSTLGLGCGAVGGLLVKGERAEMVRAVAYAMEAGITYFDTAALYGDGQSERNLGSILRELQAEVIVGTKVRLRGEEMTQIEAAVIRSVEESLDRLGRERVDLIQLHNSVAAQRQPERQWLSPADVEQVVRAFEKLAQQGKVGFWGVNGLGESGAVHEILTDRIYTVQSCFNLLNPSAGLPVPQDFPFQDYGQLMQRAGQNQVGVIAIRILAGGALSGSASRHPNAAQNVAPIASGQDFAQDVALAQRFNFLVEEGVVESLVEAAIRFAIGHPQLSTALVGISTLAQLETAVTYANRGPLPAAILERLPGVWAGFRD